MEFFEGTRCFLGFALHCPNVTGSLVLANQRLVLTFVFTKCTYTERRALWADLEHRQMNDCPWMVLGDLNANSYGF